MNPRKNRLTIGVSSIAGVQRYYTRWPGVVPGFSVYMQFFCVSPGNHNRARRRQNDTEAESICAFTCAYARWKPKRFQLPYIYLPRIFPVQSSPFEFTFNLLINSSFIVKWIVFARWRIVKILRQAMDWAESVWVAGWLASLLENPIVAPLEYPRWPQ